MYSGSKSKKIKEILIVFIISSITFFFVSPRYFSQYFFRPDYPHVFIGMSHYFEDFYYYLDQFEQGIEGNWLTVNRFTSENFPPTLVYFTHILLGRIGGGFGLTSYQSYNFFGLLFKFLFIFGSYFFIKRIFPNNFGYRVLAFLIFLYSTSFPNLYWVHGRWEMYAPVDVFRAENKILTRFGTSPSGMLINGLILILLTLGIDFIHNLENKYTHGFSLKLNTFVIWLRMNFSCVWRFILLSIGFCYMALADLTKFSVTFATLLLAGFWQYIGTKNKKFLRRLIITFIILVVPVSIVAFYMVVLVSTDPVYNLANTWDVKEYLRQPELLKTRGYLLAFGPIFTFAVIGSYSFLTKKNKTLFEQSTIIIALSSAVLYVLPIFLSLPIPGFRFIFSATYIFWSIFAVYGMISIGNIFGSRTVTYIVGSMYLLVCLFSFSQSWLSVFQPLQDPDRRFAFIPMPLYQGLMHLRNLEPKDGVVLSNPSTSSDLMIPGLTGKKTYSGHFLTTYNAEVKDQKARKFFREWTDRPTTHAFLQENNIRFIFTTIYAGKELINEIKQYYPFLTISFQNEVVTIFTYDPSKYRFPSEDS